MICDFLVYQASPDANSEDFSSLYKLSIPAMSVYSVHHIYFNDAITLFYQQGPKVLSSMLIRMDMVTLGGLL